MARKKSCLLFIIVYYYCNSHTTAQLLENNHRETLYHNEFAVYIPKGAKVADEVAAKYGFTNNGQIGSLDNFYLYRHNRIRKRSVSPALDQHTELFTDPEVAWVEQQIEKKREKRDNVLSQQPSYSESRNRRQFFQNNFANSFGRFSIFKAPPLNVGPIRRGSSRFPDPLFPQQWYLSEGAVGGHDMNVSAAWSKGYTGKGVVISILDDGIQHNHPDLAQNYDPQASTDINDGDPDPMPRDNGDNKHGTRCAGEVASVAFNDYCGVGIAYNASIGGVRMLDGTVNDAVEARAISLNPQHVDIYSASWGPEDDGKTVDGPGPLAKRAFISGVIRGRHGKGSIFVWASGNGGRHTDNCNCDGYTNSIFTLSISSASQRGFKPWYLEECSSTLASTYSSGTPGLDRSVATADMDGSLRKDRMCTIDHTGTSASAPLAAGLCALALEANPDLSWRDMQHLVVRTSRRNPLQQEKGWFVNAVGRWVSHKFGYGLMDAGAMVALAEKWTTVPPQHVCQTVIDRAELTIPTSRGSTVETKITTDGCAGTAGEVRYLEHVQAVVSLRFLPRGNINLKIISPSGTASTLLFERPRDVLSEKFDDWPFLSVHFWGEKAAGTWRLIVMNSGAKQSTHPGVLIHWQLILHGTKENPEKLRFSSSNFAPTFTNHNNNNRFGGDLIFSGSVNNDVYDDILTTDTKLQSLERGKSLKNKINKNEHKTFDHEKCHSECLGGCAGTGPQNCKSCKHFLSQDECVKTCPVGTFGSEEKECIPCHGSCAECTGPRVNQCTSCAVGFMFVPHMGICVEKCPLRYFAMNGSCAHCNNQCLECSSYSTCSSCDHGLLLFDGTCHSSCPTGTYESPINTCESCHISCETCISNSSNECASCGSSLSLYQGQCLDICPTGTYKDQSSGHCLPCSFGCASCTNESCSSCQRGWRMKWQTCVANVDSECEINKYNNGNSCSLCHSSCMSCIGPSKWHCLQCEVPLLLLENKCMSSCPKGHFSFMRSCQACAYGCAECRTFNECSSCNHKFYHFEDKCLTSCPVGYFSDRGSCLKCAPSCASCWGPRGDQCLSCPSGTVSVESTCKKECPKGFYQKADRCHPCYHNCKTCNGSGLNACTSCHNYFTLDGGMCLECRSGRYYDTISKSCDACHDSCLTCSGPQNNTCTSCQSPLSIHPLTSTCRTCCEPSDEELPEGDCCVCNNSTNECIGSGTTDKRRIALSLHEIRDPSSSSIVWSTTGIVAGLCLVNFIIFAAFVVVSKWNTKRKRPEQHSSYSYRRLPQKTDVRVAKTSTLRMASLVGSDEESDEEYRELFTRT